MAEEERKLLQSTSDKEASKFMEGQRQKTWSLLDNRCASIGCCAYDRANKRCGADHCVKITNAKLKEPWRSWLNKR